MSLAGLGAEELSLLMGYEGQTQQRAGELMDMWQQAPLIQAQIEKLKAEVAGTAPWQEQYDHELLKKRIEKAKTPEELMKLQAEINKLVAEGTLKGLEAEEYLATLGDRIRNTRSDVKGRTWKNPTTGETKWVDAGQDPPAGFTEMVPTKETHIQLSPYETAKQRQRADVDGPEFIKNLDKQLQADTTFMLNAISDKPEDRAKAEQQRLYHVGDQLASARGVHPDYIAYVPGYGFYDESKNPPEFIRGELPPMSFGE